MSSGSFVLPPVFASLSITLVRPNTANNDDYCCGQVSNTPWGEMHCYVLNPKTEGVQVLSRDDKDDGAKGPVRYRWAWS